MQQRKDEILAKKAKLADLKRQRELRQQEFSASRQTIPSAAPAVTPPSATSRQELDSLISSLVGADRSTARATGYSQDPVQSNTSLPGANNRYSPDRDGSKPLAFAPLRTVYEIISEPPKAEAITYSKGIQTSETWATELPTSPTDSDFDGALHGERAPRRSLSRRQREREERIRQSIRKEVEDELKALQQLSVAELESERSQKKKTFPTRNLTTEELNAVTSSNDFIDFIDRSSKVIERALDEDYDVLADYRLGLDSIDDNDDEYDLRSKKGRRVRQLVQFYDEKWSKKRMITDVGFSPKFPELVLSSFTKNPSAPYDPDGLVLIWNLHMRERPEFMFHASSDVLTAKFSPFHPNLVLGGTYTGQVLVWDTRARSHHPVQRTPLTSYGQSHPIYSLNIVGTQNAHNIVSTSTDGILCTWSMDMFTRPTEYLELSAPPPLTNTFSRYDDIAPTCTAFPSTDPSYLLAGTEQGTIHLIHRQERAGAKSGVDPRISYVGHTAPVMSVDFHRASGPVDLGDLLLSTGLDWSVKVWRVAPPAASLTAAASASRGVVSPLLDLSRDEAIYDARWSPVKPGVFACVDGAGALEVWDLHRDMEAPISRAVPSARVEKGVTQPVRGLNSVAWEGHEGRRVAVGGLDGVVSVFEVGGELGGAGSAPNEEWVAVRKKLR